MADQLMKRTLQGNGSNAAPNGLQTDQEVIRQVYGLVEQALGGPLMPQQMTEEPESMDAAAQEAVSTRAVSGLYKRYGSSASSASDAQALLDGADILAQAQAAAVREELRLDVDGRYPLRIASGTIYHGLAEQVHWAASLQPAGRDRWRGSIAYLDGATGSFPYRTLDIRIVRRGAFSRPSAVVTFGGHSLPPSTRVYQLSSRSLRPVEFEMDYVEGVTAVTAIGTHDHPNHPETLPAESLSIQKAFERAGFRVRTSPGSGSLPLLGAGPNERWSDMEMHDAMQVYWSRFENRPQWAMWVLFAASHEMGSGLGGIMFDDIGPNHRQGTAIFNDSFISQPPNGDPAPAAWVQRMRFWTACHEMGHAFNLAHSWQKSLGTPWIPLANEPEARSFMNYPFNVQGGQAAFFSDFEYRFSDYELLFMRHAPQRFVQMGNAAWFDHHGFQQAEVSDCPNLQLTLRANRRCGRDSTVSFQFLEPVVLELKLSNRTPSSLIVDQGVLEAGEQMTVIIKKEGEPARQFLPYAHYCHQHQATALQPDQSLYESLFLSAGRGGWYISESGRYTVQIAVRHAGEDVISNPLKLRIEAPAEYGEERIAQDYFSDDVGRILTFDGSVCLESGNDALRTVAEKLGDRRAAIHARIALAGPQMRQFKLLECGDTRAAASAPEADAKIRAHAPDEKEAHQHLETALMENPEQAAESLGHIDFNYYASRASEWMSEQLGRTEEAAEYDSQLYETLEAREVPSGILEPVRRRRDRLQRALTDDPPRERTKKKSRGK